MATTPIWKDTTVRISSSGESSPYLILLDSQTVWSGTAFKRPGQTAIDVKVNGPCADFLGNPLPDFSSDAAVQDAPGLARSFLVVPYIGTPQPIIASIRFAYDWSNDPSWQFTGLANRPAVALLDPRQVLVLTSYGADSIEVALTYRDGSTQQVTLPVKTSADFSSDFNSDFALSAEEARPVNALLRLSAYPDLAQVECGGITWEVTEACHDHALYYLNAHGGWDTLLVRGSTAEADTVERYTAWRACDNSQPAARGKVNYRNGITRTWTMHTGWMSDEESAMMRNLLESTDVYLCDLASGELKAVVLTDTEVRRKTFKGEGRALVEYTVTAQFAQQMERR